MLGIAARLFCRRSVHVGADTLCRTAKTAGRPGVLGESLTGTLSGVEGVPLPPVLRLRLTPDTVPEWPSRPTIHIPGTTSHTIAPRAGSGGREGTLRYLKAGTGAPLVLLHTVRTQAEHFRHLVPLIADRYTVYALDLRGEPVTTTPKPVPSAKKPQDAAAPRPVPEFEGVHGVWPRGDRLHAVRRAAAAYRERFVQQGRIHAVRSFDIAAAPYPARFGFHGAALAVNPFVSIVNRMLVVQSDGFDGEPKTLVWEPTVAAGSVQAPFYAQLKRLAGDFLTDRVFTRYYQDPDTVLPSCGLRAEDVDFVSFDSGVCLIRDRARPLVRRDPRRSRRAPATRGWEQE